MTLEELRDRIKNEVVLYEGELADWQWRQKGLVAEANELGITDFTRLVNDISRQINRDFGKILDLKKKIVTVALQRRNALSEADINQFVSEAERVQLSRTFVTDQWIPAILAALPVSAVPETGPAPGSTGASPVAPETKPQNGPASEAAASVDKVESVRKKIKNILDDYDKHIQAQSLKFLFKAVDYDEAELAEEIRLYLSENFYASVNPPRGNTLKEKLISTDWRHLSWWEKEQPRPNPQPSGSVKNQTGYTTTPATGDMNPPVNRATTVPGPVAERPQPILPPVANPPETRPKSGFSDAALIGLAILSALVLIWVVLRLTRGEDPEPEPVRKRPKGRTSQNLDGYPTKKTSLATRTKSEKPVKKTLVPMEDESGEFQRPAVKNTVEEGTDEAAPKSSVPSFDEVDETKGQFGLRPARKGQLWGYIDEKNRWVIEPQFELATPFNLGKASVELDGNQFFINRYGQRLRDDN
ncbi:hypothetical protein GCM10028803_43960 [Larkinella knui]|uniref:WG repeat-containing protein n=1 Tax=Larkinella knui TaxID=2025310 RepID=A0A3P1CNW4_9BACT|nr:WG repeat-containing protein [Larkinella knui]RRB15012.1 hypothetical protein EHT87_10665 [Larkinella knui]